MGTLRRDARRAREAKPFSPTPALPPPPRVLFALRRDPSSSFSLRARRFRSRDFFGDDHRTNAPARALVKPSLPDRAADEGSCRRFPAFLLPPVLLSVALGPRRVSRGDAEASFARNADVFPRRKLFLLSARL